MVSGMRGVRRQRGMSLIELMVTLMAGGSTNINGVIPAAARNPSDISPISLSGATLLDDSKLPASHWPGTVPCMKNCDQAGRRRQPEHDPLDALSVTVR